MGKLLPAQKQSVDLFYLKEKCYKEIAELTGFTLNEVKSYIQNGKRNLKICLERSSG
jgi:RNA polymerase sigma-70 factor (ECF subfamily)